MYFVRTPNIAKKLFPQIIWDLPNTENKVYLTFDDGPHPEITPWILEQLKQYNAKATFFCLGKHAEIYPEIIKMILQDGHRIGNHGYEHVSGWKTSNKDYLEDVMKSEKILKQVHDDVLRQAQNDIQQIQDDKMLFRPAYGKIKSSQIEIVHRSSFIVNWMLMPGDFDEDISSEECYSNLIKNVNSGDVIVLHDNEKSWKHLEFCLPKWLEFLLSANYIMDSISL